MTQCLKLSDSSSTRRHKSFFNYEEGNAARVYDQERYAMGADVIAGLLHVYCNKNLKVSHILSTSEVICLYFVKI